MSWLEIFFLAIGSTFFFLIFAGLQRKFSPETLANAFMSLDKLKAICPELFTKKEKKSDDP